MGQKSRGRHCKMKRNSTASYGQDNNGREQRKKRAIRYQKEDRYLKI
jgi:hypothetical protein